MPAARPLARASGLLLLIALAAGCSDLATDSPLSHARRSPEALAEAALSAVAAGDEGRLRDLMITRDEYRELLWPVLPDRQQMPFAFVWSFTAPRSRKARMAAVREYAAVPLELVRVQLGGDVEEYQEFVLYRGSRMVVRRLDTGAVGTLPLMDTLVQMRGGWKFLNFQDRA